MSGGSQFDLTCNLGLNSTLVVGSPTAQKKHRRRRLLAKAGRPVPSWLIFVKVLVRKGVGMNFRPRPKRDFKLGGGVMVVVKSWKARLVGRFQ